MSEKQHITLQLDAHRVPMTVIRDKEPLYRQAAELLNERYQYFLHKSPNASAELLWVYVALEQAVNLQSDARKTKLEPIEDKVKQLNDKIERVLNL